MTSYRLLDGVSGRPGVGSSGTQPPASPVSYSGNFEAAQYFAVTQAGMWFTGYWWYVPAGGDTGAQKFCLYGVKPDGSGSLIAAATVTSGSFTAGQFNFVPLAAPVQLSVGKLGSTGGGVFAAQTAWTAVNGFPDSNNQLGVSNPYPNGFTNGPLTAFGASNSPNAGYGGSYATVSSCFSTASSDPATGLVNGLSGAGDLFWLDVQVSDNAPPAYTGSYRLWPNRGDWNAASSGDASVNYVVSTEVHLTQSCTLNAVWYYSPPATAQLATRASVWSIAGPHTGTEAAAIASPSWSGAAASGWVKASFPGGTTLAAGSYKVAVYNGAATPDSWSPKDAATDYWQTGEAGSGITWGPLAAPNLSGASQAYAYTPGGGANSPPFSDGTGSTVAGQPTFAIGPPSQFPYLWAGVGTGSTQTQNYWVDLEATPVPPVVTPLPVAYQMRFIG